MIGSLIEKQLTTPDQYPLSLNALLLACNQSSNRDPVVVFDDGTVDRALAALKVAGLVRLVYPSHGRSVTRYQQLLGEQLAISERQAALVAVLLLRGPQTAGELRSRTARMCEFDDIAEVEVELQGLGGLPEPVVARLPRRPGQKEERWAQLLTDASTGVLGEPASDVPHGARPQLWPLMWRSFILRWPSCGTKWRSFAMMWRRYSEPCTSHLNAWGCEGSRSLHRGPPGEPRCRRHLVARRLSATGKHLPGRRPQVGCSVVDLKA